MPSSIGPNRYLPGQTLPFKPDGRVCDYGSCDQTARHCVVGETDSFGSELLYVCDQHYSELQASRAEHEKQQQACDICGIISEDCQKIRDPEEGLTGRVYTACPECRKRLVGSDPDELEPDDEPDFDDNPSPDDYEPFDDTDD